MVFLGIQLALSLIAAIAAIFALLWAHRAAREGMAMRSLLERFDHHDRDLAFASRSHAPLRISTEIEQDSETPLLLSESYLEKLEAMAAESGQTLDELIAFAIEHALDKLDEEPERLRELQRIHQGMPVLDDDEDDSEIRDRDAPDKA